MKIRNYKGSSLEKLYEVITDELGPNAVVIPLSRRNGIGGLLNSLRHEVIAIVDDAEAENRIVSRAARPEHIQQLATQQNERWKTQETLLHELQQDINALSERSMYIGARGGNDVPAFAVDWDFRFLDRVKSGMPGGIDKGDIDALQVEIAGRLKVKENFTVKKKDGKPNIIVLVGPTGSGKTTTLAKLAATWCLEQGLNVGLITTDTYRVAAVDQLKEYATLLGVDLKVAFSAGEAAKAAGEFAEKDVILVDTPGRNHYDQVGMTALRGTLNRLWNTTVFLVIPAVVDRCGVPDVLKSFHLLKPDYLIMTKVDESPHIPVLTTLSCDTDCPIAFVADGQRVPQDIRAANRDELARMLIRKAQKQLNEQEAYAVNTV